MGVGGVKNLKTNKNMKCPADKSELEKIVYEQSVEVDSCNKCQGIWLDANELEQIQDIKLNDYTDELGRIPDYVGKSILMAKTRDNNTLDCPKCDRQMERKEYGYCSQIYIDSCINGHGIWLDKDELKDLEVFFERSRIQSAKMRKGFFKSLMHFFN